MPNVQPEHDSPSFTSSASSGPRLVLVLVPFPLHPTADFSPWGACGWLAPKSCVLQFCAGSSSKGNNTISQHPAGEIGSQKPPKQLGRVTQAINRRALSCLFLSVDPLSLLARRTTSLVSSRLASKDKFCVVEVGFRAHRFEHVLNHQGHDVAPQIWQGQRGAGGGARRQEEGRSLR
jgi:hypothetical protein